MKLASGEPFTVTIPNGTALSEGIDYRDFSKAVIHMPALWTAADIGFYVSSTVDGTYQPLYDGATLIVITGPAADQAYPFPDEVAGAHFIQLWSNTAGADENQLADRDIVVELKA